MSKGVEIRSSRRKYPILTWHELPPKWKKEFADEMWKDEGFVIYKRWCYPLCDFMSVKEGETTTPLAGWDGYRGDSYFGGVVIKWCDPCCEDVYMGTYYS